MLLSFAVENFRSIAGRQELSMIALPLAGREKALDNVYQDPKYGYRILKSAVIYGANASGKSSMIRAMDMMTLLVLKSIDRKVHEQLYYDPFLLSGNYKNGPTKFSTTFIAEDQVLYEYAFEYVVDRVISEHLLAWPNNRKTRLFERNSTEIKFGTSFSGDKKVLEETLLRNHLLLTKAANSNFVSVLPAYNFFAYKLKPYWDIRNLTDTENAAASSTKMKSHIRDFLHAADTGIVDFDVRPAFSFDKASSFNEMPSAYARPLTLDTFTIHSAGDNQISWSLYNESEGTQRLYKIAAPIINALVKGATFIMDELNNSLHPEICRFIVETFHSNQSTPPAQLIFTTHDTSIMTSELFRRDQIWFTEKNKKGETRLYSLAAFDKDKVRNTTPFDKWYLSGRFGAVPILLDFEPSERNV